MRREAAFSHCPAETQQRCAASPGQSSCVQLCAAVCSCAGGTHVGWQRQGCGGLPSWPGAGQLRGHRGSPAPGPCRALGQRWAVLGSGLAQGLTGSCGTVGHGLLARGLPWGPTAEQTDPRGPDRLWGLGKKL